MSEDGSDLVARAARAFERNDDEELFRLADHEPEPGETLPDGIARVWHFAFLRSVGSPADEGRWYARALAASVLEEDKEVAARLLHPIFFRLLKAAPGDAFPDACYESARSVIRLAEVLVSEGSWSGRFRRVTREREALSFLLEATRGGRPLAGRRDTLLHSLEGYEEVRSMTPPQGERGRLKVRGSIALVHYLLRAYASAPSEAGESMDSPVEETSAVLVEATDRHRDVERWARQNLSVMQGGRFEGWVPYEIV